jgi:hypothetical protein
MPWDDYGNRRVSPAPRTGGWGDLAAGERPDATPTPPVEVDDGGNTAAKVVVGGAALTGAALLASKLPGRLGKAASTLNAIRQQLMLSGWAGPKSVLGNVGTGVEAAVEGKGTGALKEILSGKTIRDAKESFRTGSGIATNPAGSAETVNLPGWLSFPGRAMGAMDEATQAALRRSGASAEEARSATLQAPLTGGIGEVLESPAARYIHPFRRTPFNQFIEGFRKLKQASAGDRAAQRGSAVYGATGAAHGALTAEDERPYSIPFGIAASSRYGLPYGLGALVGRSLMGGQTSASGIAGSILPVSEYGVEQAMDPRKVGKTFKPAALTALERLTGP